MDPSDVTYLPEPEGPRGDGTAKVLLILAALGGLAVVICCGVGAVMVYFVSDRFAEFGEGMMGVINEEFSSQVADELRDNPVMQERIGEIDQFEVDWDASMEAPGENEFVFHVRGSKGEGTVTADCITVSAEKEDVVSGTLEMDDGTTYDLFPEEP